MLQKPISLNHLNLWNLFAYFVNKDNIAHPTILQSREKDGNRYYESRDAAADQRSNQSPFTTCNSRADPQYNPE